MVIRRCGPDRRSGVLSHLKHGAGGTLRGEVDTLQAGHYVIEGELDTSHGKFATPIEQRSDSANRQSFDHPSKDVYTQRIALRKRVIDDVGITTRGRTVTQMHRLDYPLRIDIRKRFHLTHSNTDLKAGGTGITGSRHHHDEQSYRFVDSLGSGYQPRVQTRDAAVVATDSGRGGPGRVNHLDEGSQP